MATLQKKAGRKFWYARFQVGGHRFEVSTKKSKKCEAEKELPRLIAEKRKATTADSLFEAMEDRIDDLPADKRDKKRRELADRLLQGLGSKLEISKAWDVWLKNPKKRNPSASTMAAYRGRWDAFVQWLKKTHPKLTYLHEVTPAIAESYAAHVWEQQISPSTYNLHTGLLRGVFKVLKTQAGLRINVWEDLPHMDLATNSRRELSADELAEVFKRAEGNLRYMFALGLYTGMRLGDVVNLRWTEVDLKSGYIEHKPMKTRRKNKVVRLPIHPVLEAMLMELKKKAAKDEEHVFPNEAARYAEDRSAISKVIQRHLKKCGISLYKAGTGRAAYEKAMKKYERAKSKKLPKPVYERAVLEVGFHSLRHSFVSLCAANKVPQVAIMELVGHGSPAMTRLYSHAGDEQKVKAISALPDIVDAQ